MSVLSVRNLTKRFGGLDAVKSVSLEVREGETVSIIGPNGAGKTTLFQLITGADRPDGGEVCLDGERIDGLAWPTPWRIRWGLGSVPEARRLFPHMTVRENLLMGAYARTDREQVMADYEAILELFPRVRERLSQVAGTLSGGEQQMVAMARALMGRPRLLCMDEPTMGLSPLWVDRVLELIRQVNAMGTTIFMVEQNARAALQIAHRGYVLQNGVMRQEGSASELFGNPLVERAYLGGRSA